MDETDINSERVEQLTEIFHDIAGGSTTTEKQDEDRWSTSQLGDDQTVRTIIREMIDEYRIQTSLDEDDLVTLVQEYHDGESDREIARALGTPNRDKTVTRARRNLHLFRDSDFDAPFALDQLRKLLDQDTSTAEIADTLSTSESSVRTYARVIAVENEADSVGYKYQRRFEQALDDSADGDSDDLFSETLSASTRASGLEDALGDS